MRSTAAIAPAVALVALLSSPEHGLSAEPTLYGLIPTSTTSYLTTYDLNQTLSPFSGWQSNSLIPLEITNLLPQNGMTSIAVDKSTLYGLIRTTGTDYLTTYDLNQTLSPFSGWQSNSLIPLEVTNLLPADSVASIAVQNSTLYGLIRTTGTDYLTTYDLNQTLSPFSGWQSDSLIPLEITNLLPADSISSIAIQGSTLYGLIRTTGTDYLTTYDLNQTLSPFSGWQSNSLIPLEVTNLLPADSISSIPVHGTTLY
jgi:hypothetical protein